MSKTRENYWAKLAFKNDDLERAYAASPIFTEYRNRMAYHDAQIKKLEAQEAEDKKEKAIKQFAALEKYVDGNPALKKKLREAKAYLIANPHEVSKVNPHFINGLNMLDLEEE